MKNKDFVSIGILGLGTVGSGVLQVLQNNADEITKRCGRPLRVVCACARDLEKHKDLDLENVQCVTDPSELVNHPDLDVVVELFGGHQPAHDLIAQALSNKRHVVTANKALIATAGDDLFEIARDNDVMLAYEAAVAGGIPIVKVLREGLVANRIERVVGIMNGTTNFILSEVSGEQRDFSAALADAQKLGYAEADPSLDINGTDAAHKLTIVASIAFGIPLQFDRVYIESSESISLQDVNYARELGYHIKHLGIAKRMGNQIELRVHPTLIPAQALLADVDGAMNAVEVDGNAVGKTLYYGAGAGSHETASAVIADLVDIARVLDAPEATRVPDLGFQSSSTSDLSVMEHDEVVSAYYLHLQVKDTPGVLASITEVLSSLGISIEAVLQKEVNDSANSVPLVLLVHPVKAQAMAGAIQQIKQFDTVMGDIICYHLESL